ncbi:MAG: MarR family transcriptional regulator [Candidatus Cloacimonetes bacterium]|nr:MarR family transcriptional regulator [Candidatus Cloacimonadota bacterium]
MSTVQNFAKLSGRLYKLCSKKEKIRRECIKLGRMECDLLNYLNQSGEAACMNVLADKLQVSYSRITRIVDTLVDKELVIRYPSKKDRRSWLGEITALGKSTIENTIIDFLDLQEDVLNRLPKDKINEIYDMINLYIDAYEQALDSKEKSI